MKKTAIVLISLFLLFISGCKSETEKPNPTPTPTENHTETTVVYVTKTGECYHRGNCITLRYSKIEMDLYEAASRYRPCQVCYPPVLD